MLVLKTDYRWCCDPRYYMAEEEENLMQISDEVKKCVAFIGYNIGEGKKHFGGTGFFVGVSSKEIRDKYHTYLVTAKHVIEDIRNDKSRVDDKMLVRLNDKKGNIVDIETPLDYWKDHPTDHSVDASAIIFNLPESEFDYLVIPSSHAVTDSIVKQDVIGVGNEVFLTGLFTSHHGQGKNLPIIRVGNIALMDEEKVYTDRYGWIDAYLIEARSIGGLSGSPVFVDMGLWRSINNTTSHGAPSGKAFHWLGLMHGHWDLKEGKVDVAVEDNKMGESVNMGIAIVVPAAKILEVLDQPEFMQRRKKVDDEIKSKTTPVADFGGIEPTKEEFEATLKKVSRKITPSEPDLTKPKT